MSTPELILQENFPDRVKRPAWVHVYTREEVLFLMHQVNNKKDNVQNHKGQCPS